MPSFNLGTLIFWMWVAFLIYMIAMAYNVKRTVARESHLSRRANILIMVIGALFLFSGHLSLGVLGLRFTPRSQQIVEIGTLLTFVGLCFAVWSRYHLGRNWSGTVTIKEEHELVRTGPYTWFRHPLYIGVGLALLGTALAEDVWRAIVGITILYAGLWRKARIENAMLASHFGEKAAR